MQRLGRLEPWKVLDVVMRDCKLCDHRRTTGVYRAGFIPNIMCLRIEHKSM